MRIDLQSHPKVVRILSATHTDKFRVIGGLHSVWSVFDLHSEDGNLKGYTPEALDHVIGWEGFARAMESVGWLLFDGAETLTLPEFGEHNGQSAKRRAEDQKRKRDSRNHVRNPSAVDADKKRTREEKRREEKEKSKTGTADAGAGSCPQTQIIALYHELLPELPPAREWPEANASQLRARWRSSPERQSLDWWRKFFGYVHESDFLMGRKTDFQASLMWLVKASNFAKVVNGNYENRGNA